MNKMKAISILAVLVLILNMILPTLSFALEPGKVEVKVVPSKTEVKRGEEITVSININTNSVKQISGLQIYMDYDTNILEPVGTPVRDLPAQSPNGGFEDLSQVSFAKNPDSLVFIWSTSSRDINLNYNGSLCTATFKVKEDATIGTSILKLEENDRVVAGLDDNSDPVVIPFTLVNADINVIAPVNSISLNKTSTELWTGETEKLSVTYNPEDATGKGVTWKSSDDAIAKVSQDGIVTAVSKGTATITATTQNGKEDTCEVIVKQQVTGVTLNKSSLELEKGESKKLVATVLPSNADGDKSVTWSTSNKEVATVAEDGTVTAVGKGNTTITATTQNGIKATCTVTVGVPLKSISFKDDVTQKTLNKGENFTLEVVFNPEDTDVDKTIKWSSTDTSIATVNNGVVTAVSGGDTVITATASNGMQATCAVHVEVPLSTISIKSETSIECGQTEKLVVTYNPVDTTADKTIEWKSGNEEVATIATDGTITAVGVGETTITAKASNGATATCKVTVLPVELNSISITEQNITLNKGQSQTLTVTYNPENTTEDKTVTWTSSDDSVVSVDENGVITALKAGPATITATVGDKTATTEVKVKVPLESISLNETEKTLNKGDNLQLSVTYNPDDTTADRTVTWTSTDETVATVDENGNVKALKAGTAYIKAKVEDKEVSCKIDVVVPLTGIELNKDASEILKGQTDKLSVTLSPEDTTYAGTVTWTSSDETVATVDENGNVKALKEGTVTITATAVEGENEFTDTCTVTVKEIPLNSIAIDMADFELEIGKTAQLNIICEPENTTDDINVVWSSSDPSIVSVDENGVVKAIAAGTATITAKVGDKEATVVVTAKAIPITSISLEGTDSKVLVGSQFNVNVTVNPTNATYNLSDLKIVSSNSDVLYVNEDGTVVAKGTGKAILTVEAPNGVKTQKEIEVVASTAELEGEETDGSTTNDTKVNENTSNSPKTGDIAVEMLIALMVISGMGIAVILRKNSKK